MTRAHSERIEAPDPKPLRERASLEEEVCAKFVLELLIGRNVKCRDIKGKYRRDLVYLSDIGRTRITIDHSPTNFKGDNALRGKARYVSSAI